jgi:dipeptidyl-peptidase 4
MNLGGRLDASMQEKQRARHQLHGFAPAVSRSVSCIVFAVALAAISTAARPGASRTLTVERIYSAPSLGGNLTEGLEWTPDSKRVSYFGRDGSGVELWTTDAATGQSKILVNASVLESAMPPEKTEAIQSTGLGRVEAPNYIWSPSGNSLLLIGGSSLVLLDLDTMTPKTLVSGSFDIDDPKFSPDGKWVSFVRESNLWVVNLATGDARPLTTAGSADVLEGKLDWVYPEELETSTAYWWSPDSSKVAYYQMDERPVTLYPIMDMSSPVGAIEYERYPQAGEENPIVHVGVIPVAGGATTWMDTGANTDVYLARVDWLPDSRRLAIERLNRAQNELDLLLCDAATGASSKLLTETDKFWINITDDLYFFSDDKRFLWSSERTGFRHYYLYDLEGHELDQLTRGQWEITGNGGFGPGASSHPAVDEARGYVYFISNKDNVLDAELYRLSLADKSITRITRADGWHDPLIAPDASAFVDTYSNAMTPPRQDLYRMDRSRTAVINENRVPELADYALSPVEFLTVKANDGIQLEAEMIKPPKFDPSRKYPVLVNVYGGPQDQYVQDRWSDADRDFLWFEMMAEKGYIIFALDNRGSYRRGHNFEVPIYHHLGKVELQDQLTGVRYLKSLPYVDGSRIGIWGWSYGGTMVLNALFNAPDFFKAGIAVAPVTDWRLYDTIYTERYMGRPQDNPQGYMDSSPVHQVGQLRAKLMIAHGTGDDNVHFANTTELLNELILVGTYPDDLMILPGRGHGMTDWRARVQLYQRMTDFLVRNL